MKLTHDNTRMMCHVTNKLLKMTVFWIVAPCSLIEVYRPFRGACCLHHLEDRTAQQPRRQSSLY
jgi:hypothetical protein